MDTFLLPVVYDEMIFLDWCLECRCTTRAVSPSLKTPPETIISFGAYCIVRLAQAT